LAQAGKTGAPVDSARQKIMDTPKFHQEIRQLALQIAKALFERLHLKGIRRISPQPIIGANTGKP
jgi:hypothetical protein